MVTYKDLMILERGKAREDIESGFYELYGDIPCQTDGGLKWFERPIGASGFPVICKISKQLQGDAGKKTD